MQINNDKIYTELLVAGVAGLPFSWSEAGSLNFSDAITPEQRATIEAVFAAHNPNAPALSEFITAMEAHYDAVAQAKKYDSRLTCALRAGYAGPFQVEGQMFAVWMDECNALAYSVLAEVQAGSRAQPTVSEFLTMLPAAPW